MRNRTLAKGMIGEVEFQYNPEKFLDDIAVEWGEIRGAGMSYPINVYSGGKTRTISFTFYLDGVDDPLYLRKMVNNLHSYIPAAKQGGIYQFHSPPPIPFVLGWFVKECLLESMQIEYTAFTLDLQPLRATVNATLRIIQ